MKYFILLLLCIRPAFSDDSIVKIMVSCLDQKSEGFIFDAGKDGFEMMLNGDTALGPGGAKLVSKIKLPPDVLTKGSKTSYVFNLSSSHLKKYIAQRNSPDNTFPEIKPPRSLGEALQDFYVMAANGCDFYTPSRFFDILKVGPDSTLDYKKELLACLNTVDELEQSGKEINHSLFRDIKEIQQKIKTELNQDVKAQRQ